MLGALGTHAAEPIFEGASDIIACQLQFAGSVF
jgi:hypothetical protein